MRHINEILLEIQKGEWLDDQEKAKRLGKEYSKAYDRWLKKGHPTEEIIGELRWITRPLYKRLLIWELKQKYASPNA